MLPKIPPAPHRRLHAFKNARLAQAAARAALLLLISCGANAASYWDGVSRALPTSPLGNVVAVSCHNCYGTTSAATQTEVAKALSREMDLIELDLTLHADGQVYVEHADSEVVHGTFAAALGNSALQQSNRLLFLEIKENYSSATASDTLMLGVLRAVRDYGYASAGRPVVLRAFMESANSRHQHLVRAKSLLALDEFAGIRAHVRLHTLLESDIRNGIRSTKSLGFHGVELNYQMADLFGALMQGKLLGLGVGVYTAPASMGEAFISALREDVDFITTDYDRGSSAATSSARALIQEGTALLHINAALQTAYPLSYTRNSATRYSVAQTAGAPDLELLAADSDEDRVGGSMVFDGSRQLTTWDGDNSANGGYLVTAVVNFDDLNSGSTAAIVAKSDSGGFALEQSGTLLRFGVYVNGSYRYATASLLGLGGSASYFIIGAYDGSGAVRLWINNSERTASASHSGGVVQNDSPIVIGADPQGASERRYFFKGKIQQVMVQRWRNH